jgi:site-specific recombinase XerD
VNEPDEAAWPAPDRESGRGLLQKLVAAVRPEFRSDVLTFDPADPVFGAPRCRIAGCPRPTRCKKLCTGHYNRWRFLGKLDMEEYVAMTRADFARVRLTACEVAGCRQGVKGLGLCDEHHKAWVWAGRPQRETWLAERHPVKRWKPDCSVIGCTLWVAFSWPFCRSHGRSWVAHGRPEVEEFAIRFEVFDGLAGYERVDLRGLPPQLKLEMQYALQCRRDQEAFKTLHASIRSLVKVLGEGPATSFLDLTEQQWRQRIRPSGRGRSKEVAGLAVYARRVIEDLLHGRGWDVEYPRDIWRLRNLNLEQRLAAATINFASIPVWLKDLVKRWARWRLSIGHATNYVAQDVKAISRLALFLADHDVTGLAQLDRELLERYLAHLHQHDFGRAHQVRSMGAVNRFFDAVRRHGWDHTLPTTAMYFADDFPRSTRYLPRALAEHVLTQIEDPANLDRWDDPAHRLITLIMIRCGLRISDTVKLAHDCIVRDADGAPYLRYVNHKMKRQALVPIDEQLLAQIRDQQQRIVQQWHGQTTFLFPRDKANLRGDRHIAGDTYRIALYRWLEHCDIRDEQGRPARLTPHQFRHSLGTRLINKDVPQEVVRKILDHDSPDMTAHYARLHDTTVRRHWEKAHKVNITGERVTLDPDGPLAEAAWAKQRLGRITQALPNGYCGLPIQQTCPHANACLTCPMFITTEQFLPQHRQHRQQLHQIISAAEANGQRRLVEMNQQVLTNLDNIITSLQDPGDHGQRETTADAG